MINSIKKIKPIVLFWLIYSKSAIAETKLSCEKIFDYDNTKLYEEDLWRYQEIVDNFISINVIKFKEWFLNMYFSIENQKWFFIGKNWDIKYIFDISSGNSGLWGLNFDTPKNIIIDKSENKWHQYAVESDEWKFGEIWSIILSLWEFYQDKEWFFWIEGQIYQVKENKWKKYIKRNSWRNYTLPYWWNLFSSIHTTTNYGIRRLWERVSSWCIRGTSAILLKRTRKKWFWIKITFFEEYIR